jgi:predicted metal-binding membrane protein
LGSWHPRSRRGVLIYARVGRQASAQGKPFAATGWFATGYLLTWVGFALVATAAQWALERTALLDPMMAGTILAGVYQ